MTEPVSFDEYRVARRELGEAAKLHRTSIQYFQAPDEAWYRVTEDERIPSRKKGSAALARHLSTSASCLASLWDMPARASTNDLRNLTDQFSDAALTRREWESEGAAATYCRVRTLPLILERASSDLIQQHKEWIAALVTFAWKDVSVESPKQAIAEHPIPEKGRPRQRFRDLDPEYPPNSFLTYWGFRTLRALEQHSGFEAVLDRLRRPRKIAMLWSERMLALQVALKRAVSERYDAHQLSWAISTIVEFGEPEVLRRADTVGMLIAGLATLFDSQTPSGGWPREEPLFHYPESGNAYCYVFETLSELIRPALLARKGQPYRDLLEPHVGGLLKAWDLAEATGESLTEAAIGWCSGHHPHRTKPEAWATAAVMSYIQLLHRLIGYWTRQVAATQLQVSTPRWSTFPEAMATLKDRGDTWVQTNGGAVGTNLAALFLNPVLMSSIEPTVLEPDAPLIREDQARSAILYGPPGTSKTTLVEALAGAVGWNFLEVLASDFLAKGIDNVPAQADWIFSRVMELDRCVVLFDEIDELLRDRSDEATDPFGRFLTTSMLPKLARLWEQRRVLFFVNTNWIDKADPAIRRSQRFDAALFVLPPSFERKFDRISAVITPEAAAKLSKGAVEKAIEDEDELGWFALIPFNQLDELEGLLGSTNEPAGFEDLKKALKTMGEELGNSDWHPPATAKKNDDGEAKESVFKRFGRMAAYQRIDGSRLRVARVMSVVTAAPQQCSLIPGRAGEGETFVILRPITPPPVALEADGWKATGDILLQFEIVDGQLPAKA